MSVEVFELVDRKWEMARFCDMLEGRRSERILTVVGCGGIGKTSLLRLLKAECQKRQLPVAWVDFRGQTYDIPAHSLTRQLSTEWGPEHFPNLETAIHEVITPALDLGSRGTGVAVGPHAQVSDTRFERVVGGSYFEGPVSLTVESAARAVIHREMEFRLNTAFRNDLATFTAERLAVCILDHWERAGPEVEDWLLAHLLHWLREKHLERLVVVISGRQVPDLNDPFSWHNLVESFRLKELTEEDYRSYQECIHLSLPDEQVILLHRATRGLPLYMSICLKNLAGEVEIYEQQ